MDSKNLIIGSIAIIAVVIFGLIIFLPKNGANSVKIDLSNVKVYIHKNAEGEEKGYYYPCKLSTEDLLRVKNEFNKIYNVKEEDLVSGKAINGDYKVMLDDEYIAFDKENDGIMYLGTLNKLFKVDTSIYNIVINACK